MSKRNEVIRALNDFAARELGLRRRKRIVKAKHEPLSPKLARIKAIQQERGCSLNEAYQASLIQA